MLKGLITAFLISSLAHSGLVINTTKQQLPAKNQPEINIIHVMPYPVKKENVEPISLDAKAAIAVDFRSGATLYGKNIHEKLQIASITKLMTAIIINEEESGEEKVKVSRKAANTPGSKIWLYPGEIMTVGNLLEALLIHSANDAAVALAEYNAVTEEEFVKKMNEKAEKLGLKETRFTNATGLDENKSYSTAWDISLLATYAYKKARIRELVSHSEGKIRSVDGDITHDLKTTNEILGGPLNIVGLKTGNTILAGPSFVSIAKGPNPSLRQEVITVILNSPQRFAESTKLLEWIYSAHTW